MDLTLVWHYNRVYRCLTGVALQPSIQVCQIQVWHYNQVYRCVRLLWHYNQVYRYVRHWCSTYNQIYSYVRHCTIYNQVYSCVRSWCSTYIQVYRCVISWCSNYNQAYRCIKTLVWHRQPSKLYRCQAQVQQQQLGATKIARCRIKPVILFIV